jgi:hypothetical protein
VFANYAGRLFFANFLWHRYESELSPGNPRLGGEIIVTQTTSGANRYTQCTLRFAQFYRENSSICVRLQDK